MKRVFLLFLLLLSPAAAQVPTLEKIMSDPAWIGLWPEEPFFADDSNSVYYWRDRVVEDRREAVEIDLAGKVLRVLEEEDAPSDFTWSEDRRRCVFVQAGDLYYRDLSRPKAVPLVVSADEEFAPSFLAGGKSFVFRRGSTGVYRRDLDTGLEAQLADLRLEEEPSREEEGYLDSQQERLFDAVREEVERERREREKRMNPPVFYLGKDREVEDLQVSPDGGSLVVVLSEKDSEGWQNDQMPAYVTEDGYVEVEEVRSKVGSGKPDRHSLVVLDLEARSKRDLPLEVLPGLEDRPARVEGFAWNSSRGAVQVFSQDHEDRWLALLDLGQGRLVPLHRMHDAAWHSWDHGDFGWIPKSSTLYFVSEESGYAQLYLTEGTAVRALTSGASVVSEVTPSPDGRYLYYTSNPAHPGVYEVFRVDLKGKVEQLTRRGGVSTFALSPDGKQLVVHYSSLNHPPELFLGDRQLTDTVSQEFLRYDWTVPEVVAVPSGHGRPIYSRFYAARTASEGPRPAVVFIHGAGYLQNAHLGWSSYFREFMFHTLLTSLGYHVLDMDYRASAGYGRDWRTAIYRRMGTPELEDLADGVDWLVADKGVDRSRVGVYGGSYGGFLTLMALFTRPDLFACGAALRPVTDWAHYNDPYTSRILNTPGEDAEAFEASSPIEFAAGLQNPLLMCHGMLDDNVFAQDTIRLAQRLIELEKKNWEMALYPVEAHAFRRPSSWLDEYRRVLALFERHLK